jgi:CSLREA domain-containing protein
MRPSIFIAAAVLAVSFGAVSPPPALAGATLMVTRLDDPPPNGCAEDDCSLREAVLAANAAPGADTIILPAGRILLSISGTGGAHVGDLDLTDDVTLVGFGPGATTVDANGLTAAFQVPNPNFPEPSPVDARLDGMTITGSEDGPGIFTAGNLTLENGEVTDNHSDNDGGGIAGGIGGLTTIRNSTISGNTAAFTGGGIDVRALVIENSTVANNTSGVGGGGISVTALAMVNTTVTGNDGGDDFGGGGVVIGGTTNEIPASTITNSTISNNQQGGDGGGGVFVNNDAPVSITNTILWGNSASSGAQCKGTITGGINIVQPGPGCGLSGSILGNDPGLFPLGDYGGPTLTQGIPEDSPARNSGDGGDCADTDQRGIPRPQHNPGDGCDIGAYEYMYLGDVDCGGAVAPPDIIGQLSGIAGFGPPPCAYRGDLDCSKSQDAIDTLYIARHLALLEESPVRPLYCPLIGPDALTAAKP